MYSLVSRQNTWTGSGHKAMWCERVLSLYSFIRKLRLFSSLGGSLQAVFPGLHESLDDLQVVAEDAAIVMVGMVHQILQQPTGQVAVLKAHRQVQMFKVLKIIRSHAEESEADL